MELLTDLVPTWALVASCHSPVDLYATKATISKADRFTKKALDTGKAKNVSEFVDGFDVFESKNLAGDLCLSIDVVGGVVKVVEVGVEVFVVDVSKQTIAIKPGGRFEECCCLEDVCSEIV